MNYHRSVCLWLAVAISMVLIGSSLSELSAQEKEFPIKIGFVNLKVVFRDYKKAKEMEQSINQETEGELAKIKEIEEQVKQLREEIPLYRHGSTIRKRKEDDLTEKLFDIKFKKDRAQYFLAEKMKAGIEKVYQEVSNEVEKYAKDNDFFMVLRVADTDFFGAASTDALRLEINTRDVLYWGKKYDITENIVQIINKKYEAEKSSIIKKPSK